MSNLKTELFAYLTYKIDINKLDAMTNWPPLSWIKKMFIQKMITQDYPQHIFLETTSACNLKCKMCPRTSGNTLIGHMDFELFKKAIDEAQKYGPRTFCLHLFGEPLIAPKFVDEIFYIKQTNPKNSIVLTTNGTLLDEEKARAMIQTPVDKIAVSFMSADKQNYLENTGVDKLDVVEENVKRLVRLKKEQKAIKPKIIVRMILEDYNNGEADLFKTKWNNQGVIVEVRPAHNYGGNTDYGVTRGGKKNKTRRWPCYHFWLSPAVHWNGDFSVCCNDYARKAVIGNIQDKTISELWNAKPMQCFRENQLKGNFEVPKICKDCNVWTMYNDMFFWWQKN